MSRYWKKYSNMPVVDIDYHGLKLRLEPAYNTIESKILFSSKMREKTELEWIKSYLTDQGCFVDIGANIGYYSLMVGRLGARKIILVEPNSRLHKRFIVTSTLPVRSGSHEYVTRALWLP
ncbi:MAG: hypothetical protein AAF403_06605 [Pseudomonadota bacterium]